MTSLGDYLKRIPDVTKQVYQAIKIAGWSRTIFGSLGVSALSTLTLYLAMCAVSYLFGYWKPSSAYYVWYAYVFGPALVLLGNTLAVVVFIGLVGRSSADWRREWWTRFGAWLSISGAVFLAVGIAAIFSYGIVVWLFDAAGKEINEVGWWKIAGAVVAWLGSALAGSLAGNSEKTRGNQGSSSNALQWVAQIGAVIFIVGAVLALSGLLHKILVQIFMNNPLASWWEDLACLLYGGSAPLRAESSCVATRMLPYFWTVLLLLVGIAWLFSWRFDLNTFGLNQFYRNRLVRCYLGATRWEPGARNPDRFTGFDDKDDFDVTRLRYSPPPVSKGASGEDGQPFRGPFPIINCTLNLGGSSDLSVKTRQSASFIVTPFHCGSSRPRVGFASLATDRKFADGVSLGEALSVSGAAASPNMGYNTSPLVAILLTMFNVRLAWWFPNPGLKSSPFDSGALSGLANAEYLAEEFLGLADETSHYVNVSDGGHFENLGIYELVRRRTKVIICSDAECDPALGFGSLGNVIRICETDFKAKIDIDVDSIRKQDDGTSRAHCAVGKITYRNGSKGYLIYLKASITGDEDTNITQYREEHPDFPHQTTADQFFTEDQFESYRQLGYHTAKLAFRDVESETAAGKLVGMANKLSEIWTPSSSTSDDFVKYTEQLDKIWERFRNSTALEILLNELVADCPRDARKPPLNREEIGACLELLQLMENVFVGLRLDDFWDHPDNRGWAMLFKMWAKSPTLRLAWQQTRSTFGIRFEYFCERRLGLPADRPAERV
jgi:hypothetical protein